MWEEEEVVVVVFVVVVAGAALVRLISFNLYEDTQNKETFRISKNKENLSNCSLCEQKI